MGDFSIDVPMEPPKLGKLCKPRDCDISAELDSCKKMMAYLASEDGDGHDIQLILKDGTEIPAHSFILRLRSERLRARIDAAKAKGWSHARMFSFVCLVRNSSKERLPLLVTGISL